MSLPWELRRRGLKDGLRHDQRVKEAIRKNLRELIAEEAIITSDGNKRVRIPVRYLEQYRFKYGHPQSGSARGKGRPVMSWANVLTMGRTLVRVSPATSQGSIRMRSRCRSRSLAV